MVIINTNYKYTTINSWTNASLTNHKSSQSIGIILQENLLKKHKDFFTIRNSSSTQRNYM